MNIRHEHNRKALKLYFMTAFRALLVLCIFSAGLLVGYVKFAPQQNAPTPVLVDIPVATAPEVEELSLSDDIGDFILNHEYFAADSEALTDEAELPVADVVPEQGVAVSEEEPQAPNIVEETSKSKVVLDKINVDVPLIAVVVDDMGINRKRTQDIISLQAPLTSSFLTYGQTLDKFAAEAKASGHEIMIHAPMEPKVKASLAPDTLMTDMDEVQIENTFAGMLSKFADIKVSGINNHMGSKFTEDETRLGYVMNMLKQRKMFFLDSKTTANSKGKKLAIDSNVDYVARDVFLDNENDYAYIMNQLEKAERIAAKKGFAVAICHPKSQTYSALKSWLEALPNKNIKLVHVSEIIAETNQ